ncbi:MAG: TolC family outer membrane protein [Caulobacter sp.]|nr:TolC family outer membrane protein [Caulobacter sp.]
MSKSRRAGLLAAICTAGLIAGAATPVFAESLADAIALAYQTNPTLREQRANLRALDESVVQARSGYRPDVSLGASYTSQYQKYGTPQGSVFTGFSSNYRGSSTSAALTVTQPLYTGGQVRSQISAAQADIETGRQNLRTVESSVLTQVIQAYVDVRRDIEALRIADENVDVLQRQLDEAKARFEVGEITRTDVAQSEARLAAAKSQQASARAQLAISRANYAAVVGQNPGDLEPEPSLADLLPGSVDEAFALAEVNNPGLLAADYAEQASRARVAQAKAATRPTVSLQGRLGASGAAQNSSDPFQDYDQSVSGTVSVSVPLFTGGQISSTIRQAQERNNADAAAIEGARRTAQRDVARAWNQWLGARAALVSNEEQVRAARIAFEGVRQEAQVGLRTTLDVLNAQQELRSAELALINARHDEYLASALVLAAVGKLEARYVTPEQTLYDPAVSTRKVNHSFGWVPWEPVVGAVDQVLAPRVGPAPDEAVKTAKN